MKSTSGAAFETAIEEVILSHGYASVNPKERRSALITAAVTGQIPLEEMTG